MKNHQLNHNKIFLIILSLLLVNSFVFSQGLEIQYPPIRGISPQRASPFLYVAYLYYFVGSIVAIIAFFSFLLSAIQYVISAGNPELKNRAKKRIFSAILGILILAFGPLFLKSLRREILILPEVPLETISEIPRPFELTQFLRWESENPIFDPLNYLKGTALEMIDEIRKLRWELNRVRSLLEQCKCENITSFCNFTGKECVKLVCDGEPCLNREEIQKTQIKLKMLLEKILYLGRIFADFKEKVTPELLHKVPTPEMEGKVKTIKEILKKLKEPLEELEALIEETNSLVYKCLSQVPIKCEPVCKLITDNCFFECEAKKCKPKDETDPSPCPMKELEEKRVKIEEVLSKIENILNEFLGIYL